MNSSSACLYCCCCSCSCAVFVITSLFHVFSLSHILLMLLLLLLLPIYVAFMQLLLLCCCWTCCSCFCQIFKVFPSSSPSAATSMAAHNVFIILFLLRAGWWWHRVGKPSLTTHTLPTQIQLTDIIKPSLTAKGGVVVESRRIPFLTTHPTYTRHGPASLRRERSVQSCLQASASSSLCTLCLCSLPNQQETTPDGCNREKRADRTWKEK